MNAAELALDAEGKCKGRGGRSSFKTCAPERMAPGSNPKILLTSVSTQEFHLLEW